MIRILVADDHTLVREGLKQILQAAGDFQVGGEAANGTEVLALVRREDWDVVLLDMSMPGRSGIELIKQLKDEKPRLRILVLTMHGEEQYAMRAFKAGAAGYLTKESAPVELAAAVRKVATGGVYVSLPAAERPRGPQPSLTALKPASRCAATVRAAASGVSWPVNQSLKLLTSCRSALRP
jgi:DNA-binding NarL/FixJ family response regulator